MQIAEAVWPCGQGAGFVIRRSRVQIHLPATRGICVWWFQIQLLHASKIANWSAPNQLEFLTSFSLIFVIYLLISVSMHN